ncbi:MAG TPA: hypothetical protein VGE61_04040 [Glycomyces sp.]
MTDDLFAGSGDWAADAGSVELPSFEFTIAFGDASVLASGERAGCSAAQCPHPVAHPAEEAWVQLASAVPVEGQRDRLKPRCEGMAYPTEVDFRAAVSAVRPGEADAFSLQRLRSGWSEEVGSRLGSWPERFKSKLAVLAEGWAGEDFDAFAVQAGEARALVEGVLDDIEATVGELAGRESAIYTLQGGDSGEIPYPAPLVGTEGEWSSLVALHVRPAWWHGDCITMTCEEAERALALAGADAGLAAEVREFVEERVGQRLAGLGAAVSEVRVLVGEEVKEVFAERVAAELAAYVERQAAIDEAIAEKRDGQGAELSALRATGGDRSCPSSADASSMDLAVPGAERPGAPVAPRTMEDPSPVPPGGDGTVREDETPWEAEEAEEADEDEVSGGLASGGGGFGGGGPGGGSFGGRAPGGAVLPGAGGGAPQGLFGPAVTAPAAGSSPVRGGGGLFPSNPGGAPGRGKGSERSDADEKESEGEDGPVNLARRETGNVWGYVKPNEDPYN